MMLDDGFQICVYEDTRALVQQDMPLLARKPGLPIVYQHCEEQGEIPTRTVMVALELVYLGQMIVPYASRDVKRLPETLHGQVAEGSHLTAVTQEPREIDMLWDASRC